MLPGTRIQYALRRIRIAVLGRAKRARKTLATSRGLRWDIKAGARDWVPTRRHREDWAQIENHES